MTMMAYTVPRTIAALGIACSILTVSAAATSPSTTVSEQGGGALRNSDMQTRRRSAVHRVYGPENAHVRKEVRLLEERSERSQTGFLSDPTHEVPYVDHPFEILRTRDLQENATTTEDADSKYKPIRIKFVTDALDDRRTEANSARIDFIKKEILPKTADFWSTTLAVVPVSGPLKVAAAELDSRSYCGDSEFTEVPSQHIASGIDDIDLVLYVSGTPSSRFCSGTTLAVAVACNFDQYDRPTAGAINVCLNQIELRSDGTASGAIIQDNVDVLIHEVAHVLGHSSNSYRFFWDAETGKPRTSRPFSTRTVTCVDDVQRTLILPDDTTMKFSMGKNGQRYASLVTPRVRAIARNQFDCQSLEGARLENQPTGTGSCTGDHWEEHDYYPEALSGVISPTTNIVSHLTLALMEDSGWYRANYTQGSISPWGHGAGCDFVNEPCIAKDSSGNSFLPEYSEGYFCVDGAQRGCSPALTHKMACTMIDYFYILPRDLPSDRFQYFANEPTKGGPRQADFCPLFGSTFGGNDAEQLACADSGNSDSINLYSEQYGSDSACIPSAGGDGRCYRRACIKDEMALKVYVGNKWKTCREDFQKIDVGIEEGVLPQTLVCPRLTTACPDLFCPFGCAGRGICNFGYTVNGTKRPRCECFDETDTSPGCSDSMLPSGAFLEDASGLFDNLEENFFDPLVAVFVDHPDKWTTSAWAWAAGLLTVFLVMVLCICSTFWPEKTKTAPEISLAKRRDPRKGGPSPRSRVPPSGRPTSPQRSPPQRVASPRGDPRSRGPPPHARRPMPPHAVRRPQHMQRPMSPPTRRPPPQQMQRPMSPPSFHPVGTHRAPTMTEI